MTPRRLHWNRFEGKLPPGAKAITRPSRWGNPFRIGDPHPSDGRAMTRDDVVDLFAEWIRRPEQRDLRQQARAKLSGADLACSCPDGDRCHGDVWLDILREPIGNSRPGGEPPRSDPE